MWPSTHEASAASAVAITASGMPPALVEQEQDVVGVQAGQRLAAAPRRPCLAQVRALIHQVSGRRLVKMRVLVQLKLPASSGDFACHLAISAHRLSARLSAVTRSRRSWGRSRVGEEVPGEPGQHRRLARPLARLHRQPLVARERRQHLVLPGSGVTPNTSRTKRGAESAFQARQEVGFGHGSSFSCPSPDRAETSEGDAHRLNRSLDSPIGETDWEDALDDDDGGR